jgi:S-adenosylmethionine:tRNA ribosyltransferase-isomerase
MRIAELDYELPRDLIAQHPAEPRDSARLLVAARGGGAVCHRLFRDLPEELSSGDILVINDTRVLPARIPLRRASGGAAEVLLLEPRGDGLWEALVRPYRRLRLGERLEAGGLAVSIRERLGEGRALVHPEADEGSLERALERVGRLPLPPYITEPLADPADYQTVYAEHPGSAAAPTAGLHFTPALLDRLRLRHEIATVTLGVGLDTFRPVTVEDLDRHEIHSEPYEVPPETAAAIERAMGEGRRVVAVGTTTVRVLETVFGEERAPLRGRARLLIQPGYRFRVVGGLITNFHLPRSTLLALVMAFAGVERTRDLYRTAVAERYRFYSFGDAMLLL